MDLLFLGLVIWTLRAGGSIWAASLPPSAPNSQPRHVITGNVEDPLNLRPPDAMLTVGYDRDGVGVSARVPMTASGAFATHSLNPGTYVLTVIRHPYSRTHRSMPVGLTVARIDNGDVTGVKVTIRADTALEGHFRVEAGTPWPSSITVESCLDTEGIRFAACLVADGAPAGRFILRNAFGPRVLKIGYIAAPGQRYNEPRVLLDGKDITNEPTDFSALSSADLQVVFSRRAMPDGVS